MTDNVTANTFSPDHGGSLGRLDFLHRALASQAACGARELLVRVRAPRQVR